jgi:hypothetical protein
MVGIRNFCEVAFLMLLLFLFCSCGFRFYVLLLLLEVFDIDSSIYESLQVVCCGVSFVSFV